MRTILRRIVVLSLLLATTPGNAGDDRYCSWSDGYLPVELHWVAWKSIGNQSMAVNDVVRTSRYFHRWRRLCLFRNTNGAELDTLIARTRRQPTKEGTSDVTVVLIVKRPVHKDTVSFANTKYVTINGKGYLMTKELFVFIAKQMPFPEASRMLQDTTEYD